MSDDYDFAEEMAGLDEYEMGTKLHDEGRYNFVVTGAIPGFTSTKKPKLSLSLEFIDGQFQGHKAAKDVILSPEKPAFFWKQMGWLGIDYGWAKESGQTKFSQLALLLENAQFEGEISHREWPENSGNYSENIDIRQFIANPNTSGVTGAAEQPAAAAPAEDPWQDTSEPATVGAGGNGAAAGGDDPWGTDS